MPRRAARTARSGQRPRAGMCRVPGRRPCSRCAAMQPRAMSLASALVHGAAWPCSARKPTVSQRSFLENGPHRRRASSGRRQAGTKWGGKVYGTYAKKTSTTFPCDLPRQDARAPRAPRLRRENKHHSMKRDEVNNRQSALAKAIWLAAAAEQRHSTAAASRGDL